MDEEPLPEYVGPYRVIRQIGRGGMGAVYLAHDPACDRAVAVKRIRPHLSQNRVLQERFLREARIASQLTHPSIIPIYSIHEGAEGTYYTMPYVEGETLRQILRTSLEQEKEGEITHPIGNSIPALIRIFLSVCQAIAYTHSKECLHRDLKPENIIVGKYGEVLILDWGLARHIAADTPDLEVDLQEDKQEQPELTRPGKIPGTITYMPPERALGERASKLTDIYALGVILFQLLTLKSPFHRTNLADFRKRMKFEIVPDPTEIAPYRDIPLPLANIVKKALDPNPHERIQCVEHIISDIENYIAGRPEWVFAAELKIDQKSDWEFQENVLLAKHIALTRTTDVMEWVSLMISKAPFSGNTKLEAKIRFSPESKGIGFLLSIPEVGARKEIEEGDCLWIGTESDPSCKLFRSNVEVIQTPHSGILPNTWHLLRIEKVDNHLRFFVDGHLKLHYFSHIPMRGTHVGLLTRDALFQLETLHVYITSQSAMVDCLAVPDAFLANKEFDKALVEYRRIAACFPGRAEGREATFRGGITLLEEALAQEKKRKKQSLFLQALEEFGKLRLTPAAPLEYLGKSLVYKAYGEVEEEVKCLELALRKYPKHPLLPILVEHIAFRLHESSHHHRFAAYHFALLALNHLPQLFKHPDHRTLIEALETHREPLPFIETPAKHPSIQLAFWLAKPLALLEMLEKATDASLIGNVLFAFLELGYHNWAKEHLHLLHNDPERTPALEIALLCQEASLKTALRAFFKQNRSSLTFYEWRTLFYLIETALNTHKSSLILPYFEHLSTYALSQEMRERLDALHIWAHLLENEWKHAEAIFERYPLSHILQEKSPLAPLYGCFLRHTEGKHVALAYFSDVSEVPYPPTTALLSHFVMGKISFKNGWLERAFFWEKKTLLRHLVLFYHCSSQPKKAALCQAKLARLLRP